MRRPLKHVMSDTLRRWLSVPAPPRERYRLLSHESELRPGLDVTGNRLADELEDEEIIRLAGRPR